MYKIVYYSRVFKIYKLGRVYGRDGCIIMVFFILEFCTVVITDGLDLRGIAWINVYDKNWTSKEGGEDIRVWRYLDIVLKREK